MKMRPLGFPVFLTMTESVKRSSTVYRNVVGASSCQLKHSTKQVFQDLQYQTGLQQPSFLALVLNEINQPIWASDLLTFFKHFYLPEYFNHTCNVTPI